MKLFGDLIDKTAKFADEAVKVSKEAFEQTKVVAGEAVEKGKKKVNQLQMEADIKELYKKLGALVYLQHKTGEKNDDLVAQYIAEIAKLEDELEKLMAEEVNEEMDFTVEEIKEEAVEIVDDIVEEVKEVFDIEEKVCTSCGAKADDNDIFCRECGTKLN